MEKRKSEEFSKKDSEHGTWSVLQTSEIGTPYAGQLPEHVRYETTYYIGDRTNTKIIEGPVEDVLKIIDAIKAE